MGVVATVDDAGNPEAALVDLVATSSGEVIFDTRADARKVDNIAVNPRVALVIGWNEGICVQVEGLADILSGAEREEYGRIYLERFPGSRVLPRGLRRHPGQSRGGCATTTRGPSRCVPPRDSGRKRQASRPGERG